MEKALIKRPWWAEETKHCRTCGSQLIPIAIDSYDGQSGKAVVVTGCPNYAKAFWSRFFGSRIHQTYGSLLMSKKNALSLPLRCGDWSEKMKGTPSL